MRTLIILSACLIVQSLPAQTRTGPAVCIDGLVTKDTIRAEHLEGPLKLRICNDTQGLVKVVSFKMSRYGNGLDPVEKSTDSDCLSADMRSVVERCPPDSKLHFEYIQGRKPDGKIITLNSVILTKK